MVIGEWMLSALSDTEATESGRARLQVVLPQPGEKIRCDRTGNTYVMGEKLGEGFFGEVYECRDQWGNHLAAKVLKARLTYEEVRASAEKEFAKLSLLRHPKITYAYDAFEYRATFYIITERCHCPVSELFSLEDFDGPEWLMPIARDLLQAVDYLHINQYVHQDVHGGNVFVALSRDGSMPATPDSTNFKLGDLRDAKLFGEVDGKNTRAEWLLPPEVLDPAEYGPIDRRLDVYHSALLLLQLAVSRECQFTREEILVGKPRDIALLLPPQFSGPLEKALRRHVPYRTPSAKQLWQDLQQSTTAPAVTSMTGGGDRSAAVP